MKWALMRAEEQISARQSQDKTGTRCLFLSPNSSLTPFESWGPCQQHYFFLRTDDLRTPFFCSSSSYRSLTFHNLIKGPHAHHWDPGG